jgi:hypothetical protein
MEIYMSAMMWLVMSKWMQMWWKNDAFALFQTPINDKK